MKKAETKDRIKEALELREMKQADLVEKTGIDKGQMSSYLSGRYKPKQVNLHLIAEALSVDEAWLMGFDVPMEKKDTFDKTVNDFFNEINAFDMQLKALGWTYEAKGCHASNQPVHLELHLDNSGNFTDEGSHRIGCGERKCENCAEKESYYLFTNGEISFKVSIDDYDSFINDGKAFFKERLQQLLKKSMKQMFIDNSVDNKSYKEPKAAHERTDIEVTDEMRKYDDDLMDNDDLWNK